MSKDKMTPEFYTTLPWRIAAQDWRTSFYVIHGKRSDNDELQILKMDFGPHPDERHLDRMRDNVNAIVTAVNNTWGQNINPEAVPDMYEALKAVADCLGNIARGVSGTYITDSALNKAINSLSKAALDKASL